MSNDVIDLSSTHVRLFKPVPNLRLIYTEQVRQNLPHFIGEVELNKKVQFIQLDLR